MSEFIKEIDEKTFDDEINGSEQVLVDFWAAWCGPCRMLAPVLEEFAKENAGKIKVCKVNVDENEKLCIKYSIASIPTLMVFKNGKLVNKSVGFMGKEELKALFKENA